MPRKNQIELQGLAERVLEMHVSDHMAIAEIAASLRSEGYNVSRSGIGRTVRKAILIKKDFDAALAETKELITALKDVPGIDIMEAAGQLMQVKLFDEFKKIESLSEMDTEQIAVLWSKITKTQVAIARVKLEFAKGYKQGVLRAAQILEEAGKKEGWSDESMALVKRKLLNLKPIEVKTIEAIP